MIYVTAIVGIYSGVKHGNGLVCIASASQLVIKVKAYAYLLAEISCKIAFYMLLTGTFVAALVIVYTYMGRLGIRETEIGCILYPEIIRCVKNEILRRFTLKIET